MKSALRVGKALGRQQIFGFHTYFMFLYHIIRLLNCYKNIYGLHRFSIENSSKLAISHLFWRFNTFFHTFFNFFFSSYNPPTQLLQEYIWITQVFYLKFPKISDFTPFFAISHLFFTPFSNFFSALHFSSVIRNFQKKKQADTYYRS